MKTTIELIEWLEVESKLAKEDDSAVSAAYLRDAALRLRELEVQLAAAVQDAHREARELDRVNEQRVAAYNTVINHRGTK